MGKQSITPFTKEVYGEKIGGHSNHPNWSLGTYTLLSKHESLHLKYQLTKWHLGICFRLILKVA